jgi:hypothetical protein
MMLDALPDTVDTVDTVDMTARNRFQATCVLPGKIQFDQSRDRALATVFADSVHPVHCVHPGLPPEHHGGANRKRRCARRPMNSARREDNSS